MGELEGFYALWYREIKVFTREKSRVVSSLVTPLLWMVVFGGGLGSAVSVSGMNYQVFIFPGILTMTILFSSVFFGLYIVWDKKIDFFKEVLVAPLSRTTIFAGKMMGGSIDALLQGSAMLLFGIILGVKYSVMNVILAFVFMFVLAAALVSLGLILGSNMESVEGFQLVISFLVFPMFFFSGALFPIGNLPHYLLVFTLIDPVTYAVDGLRGVLLGTSQLPVGVDFMILTGFAVVLIGVGTWCFKRLK
ncbi:MAG TPA: ABC transporter permease [Candidatus Bathyarchaeia archaeon]|nr:ABC transporter permease [Candidatus Bathyarchaeia archaeon]